MPDQAFQISPYFKRIGYKGQGEANLQTLQELHLAHLLQVPFEDLNIHYGIPIRLGIPDLYNKVMVEQRGGFCYELNGLFRHLLIDLGFETKLIEARVFTDEGEIGVRYDHAAILIQLEELWLADVGFGDLFLRPLKFEPELIQKDEAGLFVIKKYDDDYFQLDKSENGKDFAPKYIFSPKEEALSNFLPQCELKQVDPDGHFVKNRICTKATPTGRITLYNDKMIESINGDKRHTPIPDKQTFETLLKEKFGITMPG